MAYKAKFHAIFVRDGPRAPYRAKDETPEVSVRSARFRFDAFDLSGDMIDADLTAEAIVQPAIARLFANRRRS